MAGIERPSGRAKNECLQDTGTTVLPQHTPPLELGALQLFISVEEIGPLLLSLLIHTELRELFVEQVDEDVSDART
jgi:hypothetical protein